MIDITSREMFQQRVVDAKGLVIVDFYTPTCGPCKSVKTSLARLETETGTPVFIVDCEAQPDMASEFGVTGVPTLMLWENGYVLNQHTGICTYDFLKDWVDE